MLPKQIKELLANPRGSASQLLSEINEAVTPGSDFPTMEEMPKNLAENNVPEELKNAEIMTPGKMQYLDIDITGTGGDVRLRDMTRLEDGLEYVIIRVKATVSQLRKEGVKFKLWFPK
jgi:hypothetical protein